MPRATNKAAGTGADHEGPRGGLAPEEQSHRIGLVVLCILASVVGVVTGLGAVLFRDLIGLIHNVMFLGHFAYRYDANIFTPPSPWGPLVILVPAVGAIGVTFLVSKFAPEARGHGVPEVMDAIYYNGGRIRPVVAVVKSLASALAIGSGAAVGREGPIIQIGSALGSTLGQVIKMLPGQRITLVAAGAGAGIAATFNTPIGGVMFAIELMMPEVSVRTFLPVAIATGMATFIGRIFFGQQPAFTVPPLPPLSVDATAALTLCLYAVLGAITGLAATGFVRGLHLVEDLFDKIKGRYLRHILGMLLVGVLIYGLQQRLRPLLRRGRWLRDHPGDPDRPARAARAAVRSVRRQAACDLDQPRFGLVGRHLLAVAVHGGDDRRRLRVAADCCCTCRADINVPAFAMVGMGAMVGGGTGAAMTAVTMIFEMTRDYDIVLPMILAVALSVGVRRMLSVREHLHAEAVPARPRHPQGAARQHVPGAPRARRSWTRTCWCCRRRRASMRSCASTSITAGCAT